MEPLLDTDAPHAWVTVCPLANGMVTVQVLVPLAPAVTWTSAWKPPVHWLVMVYEAAQERCPPAGGVVGFAGGVVGRAVVGFGAGVVGYSHAPESITRGSQRNTNSITG